MDFRGPPRTSLLFLTSKTAGGPIPTSWIDTGAEKAVPAWLPSGAGDTGRLGREPAQGSRRPKCDCLLETEKQYLHFKAISPGNQISYFGIRPCVP